MGYFLAVLANLAPTDRLVESHLGSTYKHQIFSMKLHLIGKP